MKNVSMRKQITKTIFLVFLSCLMLSSAFGQETSGYSITDFLSATFFNEVEVSPDARHVAFITIKDNFEKNKAETTIWKIDVDESGRKTGMSRLIDDPGEYSSLKWSSDGRFLAFKSTHKSLKPQLVIFDVRNKKSFLVTDPKKFPQGISAFNWSPDGKRIYFAVRDLLPLEEQEKLKAKSEQIVPFAEEKEISDKSTFYRMAVTDFGKEAESFVSIEDTLVEFVLSPDEKTIAVRPQQGVFLLETTGKQSFRRLTPPFICFDPGMK